MGGRAWRFELHPLVTEEIDLPLAYWRTSTGYEVDLIVGDLELAIEFKGLDKVGDGDCRGLRALREDQSVRRALIVGLDPRRRELGGGIEAWPWYEFCAALWAGDVIRR